MLKAVVEDFALVGDVEVVTHLDHRLARQFDLPCHIEISDCASSEMERFCSTAANADWTFLIAPEFDEILFERASSVVASGGKLLGPCPEYIQQASNKLVTAQALQAANIPTPLTLPLQADLTPLEPYTAGYVVKPNDGAGSIQVTYQESVTAAKHRRDHERYCIQPWIDGLTCSVLLLCGPQTIVSLKATEQHLTQDGNFTYLGGSLPLPQHFDTRARHLAEDAVCAFGQATGFIGVDLVLGPNCEDDVVIEVNPRLTTSYVGQRCLSQDNLAEKLLAVMRGEPVTIGWKAGAVRFDAQGNTSRDSTDLHRG